MHKNIHTINRAVQKTKSYEIIIIILRNEIFSEKDTFEVFVTYAASSTPFSLNIYNFANCTNSNKSFYTGILESIYFEKI